jgi:hypothetical protein
MNQNNLSVLPFYDSRSKKFVNRANTFGQRFPLLTGLNEVPAINLIVDKDVVDVFAFNLINVTTGVTTDILNEAKLVGLAVVERDNYSVIFFPSTIKIPGTTFDPGIYEIEMNDGLQTWYSEDFCFKDNLEGMLKIKFCASSPIYIEKANGIGAEIHYNGLNTNTLYLDSTIIKEPNYQFEDTVQQKLGRNLKLQTISFKEFGFEAVVPDYIMDTLSLLWHHVDVTFTQAGEVHHSEEVIINNPDWIGQGLGSIFVQFRNDITIVTNATSTENPDCGPSLPESGDCLGGIPTDITVKGFLRESTQPSYLFGYVEDENGNRYNLQPGDLVLVASLPLGFVYPYSWNGSGYDFEPYAIGATAFDQNTNKYWFSKPVGGFFTVTVDSYDNDPDPTQWVVYGTALPDTFVEILALTREGNIESIGFVTAVAIEAGVTFTWDNRFAAVGIRVGTLSCGYFQASDWFFFQGFNYWAFDNDLEIEGDRDGSEPMIDPIANIPAIPL